MVNSKFKKRELSPKHKNCEILIMANYSVTQYFLFFFCLKEGYAYYHVFYFTELAEIVLVDDEGAKKILLS